MPAVAAISLRCRRMTTRSYSLPQRLLAGKMTLAALRAEMTRLAKQLPEYDTVLAMYGVGEATAAQLMAEIGDVRRFPRHSSIVGFAGADPGVDDSGKHSAKSVPTTKRGSTSSEEDFVSNRLYLPEKVSRGRIGVPVSR